ncbi:MAG: universal stress protein [Oscillatoriales cyanobacterium]|nr:MAG: universal stress protein [Oscillatoriales cyanobacterium]
MTNFSKILVAIDDSEAAVRVFERALDLAKQNDAQLVIFHGMNVQSITEAMPLMGTGIGIDLASSKAIFEFQQKQFQQRTEELKASLAKLSQRAADCNVVAETVYRIGDPGTWICELARTTASDLIVMGRRGFCGLKEVLLGSVSNYVMHQAHCSVMVVQGSHPEVAPDDSAS